MVALKEFKWTPDFSVGHPVLDSQHQQLFERTNLICQAIINGKGADVLGETLKGLVEYAGLHFEYEEKLMRGACLANFDHHLAEHQKFREQLIVILKKVKQQKEVSPHEIADFLKFWINNHILGIDLLYKGKLTVIEEL